MTIDRMLININGHNHGSKEEPTMVVYGYMISYICLKNSCWEELVPNGAED